METAVRVLALQGPEAGTGVPSASVHPSPLLDWHGGNHSAGQAHGDSHYLVFTPSPRPQLDQQGGDYSAGICTKPVVIYI